MANFSEFHLGVMGVGLQVLPQPVDVLQGQQSSISVRISNCTIVAADPKAFLLGVGNLWPLYPGPCR